MTPGAPSLERKEPRRGPPSAPRWRGVGYRAGVIDRLCDERGDGFACDRITVEGSGVGWERGDHAARREGDGSQTENRCVEDLSHRFVLEKSGGLVREPDAGVYHEGDD